MNITLKDLLESLGVHHEAEEESSDANMKVVFMVDSKAYDASIDVRFDYHDNEVVIEVY